MNTPNNIVPYYRVSTRKQENSGLGLDAQRTAVNRYSSDCTRLTEFVEIESGKKSDRPQLKKAIELCRSTGATLVVAKLDRLARNLAFMSALMESGIEFIACDMPQANRLTIHIIAAIAEDEAARISYRTKASLAELKAKGVRLGSAREGHWEAIEQKHGRNMRGWAAISPEKKAETIKQRFADKYAVILPLVKTLLQQNLSPGEIAKRLNGFSYKTPTGKPFTKGIVYKICQKIDSLCLTS